MADINKELLTVIQKNLPEATVGVIREQLIELDRLRGVDEKLKDERKLNQEFSDKIDSLRKENDSLVAHDKSVSKREKDVESKEIWLELSLVKEQLKLTQESREEIARLAEIVFRNKTIIETMNRRAGTSYWTNGQVSGEGPSQGFERTQREE